MPPVDMLTSPEVGMENSEMECLAKVVKKGLISVPGGLGVGWEFGGSAGTFFVSSILSIVTWEEGTSMPGMHL